ncbi:unnamed protein product [Caenorhabditis auriculariae]|uniref:DM domain-containing protein n=1 Tax=Caenorhabditis auriculariae TaxID=2777116 RepID=A0A8S1H2J2_9PELO|nr:unnamed protein product [Caenorhabditis auriculariae]
MNIEEILPELFGEKRVYYCQRCLNHGLREKRKNHKLHCLYRMCQCSDCIMVERRRELNSRLMQIDGSAASSTTSSSSMTSQIIIRSDGSECTSETTGESGCEDRDDFSSKPKERRPNCQRCAQHNVVNRLKGHKRSCPFKECGCPKCQVVVERQKLMADQIKLRRRQKREKNSMMIEKALPSPPVEAVCMKCTQQAIGYQQLLAFVDPTADPMITLSAILAACPHKTT